MRDIEVLRQRYREVPADALGLNLPRGARVFLSSDIDPAAAVKVLQAPLDVSQQKPLFDPVTGKRYFIPGVDDMPSDEHPPGP